MSTHDLHAPPLLGLVLSGGGARSFAHIGTLRVLERHDVTIGALAGTSMGAILAALYASGLDADDLQELAHSVTWRDVIDLSFQAGLLKGEKLENLLREHLPEGFSDLAIPLAVTCTDVETGQVVVFTGGDLVTAVRASSCFPGAFEPIQIDGRTLADGGICNNLPVDALALMGATFTIASDVTPPRHATYVSPADDPRPWWERVAATVTLESRTPMAAMTLRASDIMMRILTDSQYVHHPADLRIQHELPTYRLESFGDLDAIVAEGEAVAEEALVHVGDLLQARAPTRR